MNSELESSFVNTFIAENKRERFLFLLGSKKRRYEAIGKLCHNYDNYFVPGSLESIPKPNSDPKVLAHSLINLGAKKSCYCISSNINIDGMELDLIDAMKGAVGYGIPSLVICDSTALAYFEAEQGFGPPPRYFLKRHP